MDEDYGILEETALEEVTLESDFDASAEFEDYSDDDDDRDWEEEAYWDEFQRQERQDAYDEQWGDPLDMPSYGS